jgi:hypothetical protein
MGEFAATGIVPNIVQTLRDERHETSLELFKKRVTEPRRAADDGI